MKIYYNDYLTTEEKTKILDWLDCQWEYWPEKLGLHSGMNYSFDISDIIGRTANIDIEI